MHFCGAMKKVERKLLVNAYASTPLTVGEQAEAAAETSRECESSLSDRARRARNARKRRSREEWKELYRVIKEARQNGAFNTNLSLSEALQRFPPGCSDSARENLESVCGREGLVG